MNARTRNTLSWWALAACGVATVGAIFANGSQASTYFAIGAGLLAIVVAALSDKIRFRRNANRETP